LHESAGSGKVPPQTRGGTRCLEIGTRGRKIWALRIFHDDRLIQQANCLLRFAGIIAQDLDNEVTSMHGVPKPFLETQADGVVDGLACISASSTHCNDRFAYPLTIHP